MTSWGLRVYRLKILHIITRLDMGGSAESVLQLASAQKIRGHEVAVAYGLTTDHQDPSFFDRTGIPGYYIPELIREISPVNDVTALGRMWALARKFRPHVIHTHATKAGIIGRIGGRLAYCPAIVHSPQGHIFYGHFSPERTDFFVKRERFASRFCDRLLPVTETEAEDYIRLKVAPREKMVAVPMGIYLGRFKNPSKTKAEMREELGIHPDTPVVGWIGRLDPIKDCHTFISSFRHLERKLPGVRYLVVGNGEERSAILQRVEDMPGKVVMTGRRTDISELLTAMDALALTSLNEGLGRVIVEAMTAGVPVVATAVGGVPEILGGAGVLVPTREPEALAGALQNMLANDAFRAELVEKGRKRAERYSIESAVNTLEELYTEILRSKGQALS